MPKILKFSTLKIGDIVEYDADWCHWKGKVREINGKGISYYRIRVAPIKIFRDRREDPIYWDGFWCEEYPAFTLVETKPITGTEKFSSKDKKKMEATLRKL